jgi:hypothetical protein
MAMRKHMGRLVSTGKKVAVVFRYIYDENGNVSDSSNALVVDTDALPNMWMDAFMAAVDSTEGQDTINFYEVAMRKTLPDGRFILPALMQEGRMRKVRTNDVMMEPDNQVRILLSDLNEQLDRIAQGLGEAEGTLTTQSATEIVNQREQAGAGDIGENANESRAYQLRTQANMLRADADRLEAEAEQLHPLAEKPRRGRPPKQAQVEETADVAG